MKLTEALKAIPVGGSKTFNLGSGHGDVKRSSVTALMTRLKNEEDIHLTSTKVKVSHSLIVNRIK